MPGPYAARRPASRAPKASRRSFLRWSTVLLLCLYGMPAAGFEPLRFFPLAPGNTWLYDVGGTTGALEVGPDQESVGSELAWPVSPTTDGFLKTAEYFTNDDAGLRYHGVSVPFGFSDVTVVFDPPISMSPASTSIPSTHQSQGDASQGDAVFELSGPDPVLAYSATSKILSMESVSVPAGTFSAARIELTFTITGSIGGQTIPPLTGTSDLWFAEDVGKVKEVASLDGETATALLVDYELAPEPQATAGGAVAVAGLAALPRARRSSRTRRPPRFVRR